MQCQLPAATCSSNHIRTSLSVSSGQDYPPSQLHFVPASGVETFGFDFVSRPPGGVLQCHFPEQRARLANCISLHRFLMFHPPGTSWSAHKYFSYPSVFYRVGLASVPQSHSPSHLSCAILRQVCCSALPIPYRVLNLNKQNILILQ